MANYQKLIDVGAIWDVAPEPKTSTFYGIELPDSKRSDRTICIFIDIVFQAIQFDHLDLPFPDKVTASLGKNSITFDEYLENLRAGGFDVDALLEKGAAAEKSLNESITNRKTKAASFFKLIQSQFVVDDDDVRKYIDGESIYDLLQLVLDHADSTRARLKAIRMHANDPKQADKVLVRECWDDWQKMPDRYDGKAAFARDMRDKFPNLKSQPVIEGWCRAWEKES